MKRSVLIVDDDPDIRFNLEFALSTEGYQTILADNGETALAKLAELGAEQLPTHIILDIMMPVMDGNTFLKQLKQKHPDWLAKISVIVATAMAAQLPKETLALSSGLLKKPFDVDHLFDLLCKDKPG